MGNVYDRGSDILTLISEDYTGRKLDKKRVNTDDEEEVARTMQAMLDKYGLNLHIVRKSKPKTDWLKADEEFTF